MARIPRGHLVVERLSDGSTSYAARFRWQGKRYYRSLGLSTLGMTKKQAESAMTQLVARVVCGAEDPAGRPPEPEPVEVTFAEAAASYYERCCLTGGRSGRGLSERGRADLDWALRHCVAWFGSRPLSAMTTADVEGFVLAKTKAGLAPSTVRRLARLTRSILAVAVRHEQVVRNVAEGVVVKVPRHKGSALTSGVQWVALLDAAGALDEGRRGRRGHARALLATLAFAGLRIDEALSLRWRDVDLASGHGDLDLIAGRIKVRRSKTDAGEREVDVLLALREELVELKARRDPADPDERVFGTSREPRIRSAAKAALEAARAAHKAGRTDATRSRLAEAEAAWEKAGKESPSNVRRRYLAPAAEDATAALIKGGRDPLPRLTPHSLRRSFASLLVAIGRDPLYVADQLGHVDPGFSLRTYARVVRLRENERAQLKALAGGEATTVADLDRIARSGQGTASHGASVVPEVGEVPTS